MLSRPNDVQTGCVTARSRHLAHFRHTLSTGEPYHAARTVEQRADIKVTEAYDWKIERVVKPVGRFGVVCHFYDLSVRQQHEAEMTAANERQQILMRELAHRGKNMMTVIQSVARRTFDGRRDVNEALKVFSGRLQAFAGAYGILTGELANEVQLATLVEAELQGFASRASISGLSISLQ